MQKVLILALFSFSILSSCKKEDTPTSNNNSNSGSEGYYFKGDINGISYHFIEGEDNYYNAYTGGSSIGTSCDYGYGGKLREIVLGGSSTKPSIGIGLDNFYTSSDCDDSDEFLSIPFVGTHTDWTVLFGNEVGPEVSFSDGTNEYSTVFGDQTGSSLVITGFEEETDPTVLSGSKAGKVTGTLNCKLYDDNGNYIYDITNGEFVIRFSSHD